MVSGRGLGVGAGRRRVVAGLVGLAVMVGACTTEVRPGHVDGAGIDGGGIDGGVGLDIIQDVTPDSGPSLDAVPDVPVDIVPVDVGPKPGEFLYPCRDNAECYAGFCVAAPEGDVCTRECGDGCPSGWSCKQAGGADLKYICVPLDAYMCRPCLSDADCNTEGVTDDGVCVHTGISGSLCTRRCSDTAVCPDGFSCSAETPQGPDGPTLDLCVAPDLSVCSCTPRFVEEGATTICEVTNEFGTCEAELSCTEVGPFPSCPAREPAAEVCNNEDDDCDGETDEDAQGCVTYFQDPDGDGWGQGAGSCLCVAPGDGWVEQGGDCNELVTSINPGAVESCNGLDDDCDGETDEEGAAGCVTHYLDQDSDGYGMDLVTACLCAGAEGWSAVGGDCMDQDDSVSPAADEVCNGADDDCDGATDEIDAVGCKPLFLDGDGDGFGLSDKVKCLCGPTGVYIADKPGDCDDSTVDINPNAPELCNGVDDNCNGETDEGESASMCPELAHGTAACVNGSCGLVACDPEWSDVDGDPLNGCECTSTGFDITDPPDLCTSAMVLGSLSDAGEVVEVTHNLSPEGDEDWYTFTGIDGADPGGCDTFHVRVEFLHNPAEQFVFDVRKGDCTSAKEICVESREFDDATDFFSDQGDEPRGECPCVNGDDDTVTAPGVQLCADQTAAYFVRVYRAPGADNSCAAYTLRISNGQP